ncbi:MAG: acetylxylan esterase [Bacteroidales bacterium]|nr:acetylxylan esterase [Bacteroidales bacterium]MBQ2502591.1 acetylxylan esterase [Bacteroidales bacterium]MBQ3976242.1 acetylxylan esterase [Bacteroidales bacterium]MBR4001820.1 acetylxylan esterase [Bacteroidales bacterium]
MKKLIVLTLLFLGIGIQMNAQSAPGQMPPLTLEDYFSPSTAVPAGPDAKGFVQRWTLLEPIGKPGLNSNAAFNDSYLRKEFATVYFKDQNTMVPKDGQTVTLADKTKLKWHCLDSKKYNVKLYRFASGLGLRPTEGVFMAVTVINVDKDVTVRMAVGSNSGSIWYVNGEEAILLSNDRRMVVDDCVSPKLTLHKGKNVVRGTVINGPGMSDFCIRFYDENGNIFKDFTVTNQ